MYAIGGSQNLTILSEGNRFMAPDDNSKEVRHHKLNLAYTCEGFIILFSSISFSQLKFINFVSAASFFTTGRCENSKGSDGQ